MNPEDERKKYENEGDTDKVMTVLRLEDQNGKELGAIAWFAVHCVSMSNTNLLISGDNKGYASYLFERLKNNGALPGRGSFIAAFGQTNEGDVSPNTNGTSCPDGKPCAPDSTCGGRTQGCTGKGPGRDEFESTQIIGTKQFKKALELYDTATEVVSGPIEFRHTFLNIDRIAVQPNYTSTGKPETTCRAAMGYSFAAGTTDGPGDFDFHQGMNKTGNPFWDFIKNFIKKPSEEQKKCQYPKPVLLDVGEIEPTPWTPTILPIHLAVIGKQLILVGVPGEFTTMAGRRMRERIKSTLIQYDKATQDTKIVISGLTNAYSGYTTTYEEYIAQRYEAASTMYGPHTLAAYIQEMDKLAMAIGEGVSVPSGETPQNLSSHLHTFNPGVVFDSHPIGSSFGAIHTDVQPQYKRGDVISVAFWGAHPKNDYMIMKSFLTVEQLQTDGSWTIIRTDADWDTRFHWTRHWISESIVTIQWFTDNNSPTGTFRIKTYGNSKAITGVITPYEGVSSVFKLM
jgi:neutral ceramidase